VTDEFVTRGAGIDRDQGRDGGAQDLEGGQDLEDTVDLYLQGVRDPLLEAIIVHLKNIDVLEATDDLDPPATDKL